MIFRYRFYTWRNILIFSKSTCTCHCIRVCIISFIIFAGGWWDVNTKFLCHVRCQDCISISCLILYFFYASNFDFYLRALFFYNDVEYVGCQNICKKKPLKTVYYNRWKLIQKSKYQISALLCYDSNVINILLQTYYGSDFLFVPIKLIQIFFKQRKMFYCFLREGNVESLLFVQRAIKDIDVWSFSLPSQWNI